MAMSRSRHTFATIEAAAIPVATGPWKRVAMTLGAVAVVTTAVAIWALGSSNETPASVARFELTLPEESAGLMSFSYCGLRTVSYTRIASVASITRP